MSARIRGGLAAVLALPLLAVTVGSASAATSPNLIVNGGAEIGDPSLSGYSAVTIPGWEVTGTPTVIRYGTPGGFPGASAGPADGGAQFFGGGQVGSSTMTQTDSLASAATAIDGAGVTFTLDGWLGGYGADPSATTVTVTFLSAAGGVLGATSIGPVSAWNRGLTTELLERTATGRVPIGARSARIEVAFDDENITSYDDAYADNLSLTISAAMPAPSAPTPPPSQVHRLDHVFMIYLENHGFDDIVGSPNAPYINSLIANNGLATSYYALTHPSDPNYYPILGGSDFGLHANCAVDCFDHVNLTDRVEAAHESWAAYGQSMPSPCATASTDDGYVPDEMPFLAFHDVVADPARCAAHVLPLPRMTSDLASTATTPSYVWFAANECTNMEGCDLAAQIADNLGSHQYDVAEGDAFLSRTLPTILDSPAWQQQRSAIFITWDEDYDNKSLGIDNQGNHVATIVLASPGSGMRQGHYTDSTHYTHYSLQRTIELALGLSPLTANDRYATPMNGAWR